VENGAADRIIDWASFFIVNGSAMPPIEDGVHKKVALQASVTYKCRVIPADVPALGRMEWMFNQQLRERGEKLISDGRVLVDHVQSFDARKVKDELLNVFINPARLCHQGGAVNGDSHCASARQRPLPRLVRIFLL
jgi:hypothetical protein